MNSTLLASNGADRILSSRCVRLLRSRICSESRGMTVFDDIKFARSDIQSNAIDVVVIKMLAAKLLGETPAREAPPEPTLHNLVVDNALERLTEGHGGWTVSPWSRWNHELGRMF